MSKLTDETRDQWYVTAFGEDYPQVYKHRDDASADGEVGGLVELMGLQSGQRVLDVCCGAGRHAAAMARRGLDVTGLDLSEPLLAEAAQRPELVGRLVRADIREIPFESEFDAVTNLFTSFGYFDDDAENARALARMARALKPGGWLLMDHVNRAHVEANLVAQDEREAGELKLISRRRIERDRVIKDLTIVQPDGSRREVTERVRLYRPDEIRAMFAAAGLIVDGVFGSLAGDAMTDGSDRMIVLGIRQ